MNHPQPAADCCFGACSQEKRDELWERYFARRDESEEKTRYWKWQYEKWQLDPRRAGPKVAE